MRLACWLAAGQGLCELEIDVFARGEAIGGRELGQDFTVLQLERRLPGCGPLLL